GECPHCHAKVQYGDACEACSTVYSPTELIDPYSTLTRAKPVLRSSEHFFFRLSDPRCVEFLREWVAGSNAKGDKRLQSEVLAKAREWLGSEADADASLAYWALSHDEPYSGLPLPDAPGQYLYVSPDAPVGPPASLQAYCEKSRLARHALT